MRLAWLTDIHLNFLNAQQRRDFAESVAEQAPDAVLIGGDISEAHDLAGHLKEMARWLERPIYFVLGNHDFYRGSFDLVQSIARRLSQDEEHLTWLTEAGVVELTAHTALVGHDGWADARFGDFESSDVILNDYFLIDDLSGLGRSALRNKLQSLGDAAAASVEANLSQAIEIHRDVILLTHVPPFREACWYDGRISDDYYLPHFSCGAVGRALEDIMATRPDRHLAVLCGHTHGSGEAQIGENLHVLTGEARYGLPTVQRILEVG